MPLPHPTGKEERDHFISRCMGDKNIQNDFKTQQQRLAVCYAQWKKSKQKKTKGGADELDCAIA